MVYVVCSVVRQYVTNKNAEAIKQEFPFFPCLHQFVATCPNITPITITTGIGPNGPQTIHIQPASNNEDDSQPQALTSDFSDDKEFADVVVKILQNVLDMWSQELNSIGSIPSMPVPAPLDGLALGKVNQTTSGTKNKAKARAPAPSTFSCQKLELINASAKKYTQNRTIKQCILKGTKSVRCYSA